MKLNDLLKTSDPAAGARLTDAESARVRDAIATSNVRSARGSGMLAIAASVLLMAVALAAIVSIARTAPRSAPTQQVTQLKLTAPGGTRMIWFVRKD